MVQGAYTADRAAALAGVPKSTVHYWARSRILIPSVSASRLKLWSFSDLMALRTIDWLRRTKPGPLGHGIPRTQMKVIRRALAELRRLDLVSGVKSEGTRSSSIRAETSS